MLSCLNYSLSFAKKNTALLFTSFISHPACCEITWIRAVYECVCFKVGPLGGIEVELYRVLVIHGRLLLTIFERIISENELFLKFCIPLPLHIYITLQNSSYLQNDHLKNCKRQSTVGVTWLPQCHLAVPFWNIHFTHNSIQWYWW